MSPVSERELVASSIAQARRHKRPQCPEFRHGIGFAPSLGVGEGPRPEHAISGGGPRWVRRKTSGRGRPRLKLVQTDDGTRRNSTYGNPVSR
jgi:hypothetical protein